VENSWILYPPNMSLNMSWNYILSPQKYIQTSLLGSLQEIGNDTVVTVMIISGISISFYIYLYIYIFIWCLSMFQYRYHIYVIWSNMSCLLILYSTPLRFTGWSSHPPPPDPLIREAREHAIHEAWKHAEKANELSKESAEAMVIPVVPVIPVIPVIGCEKLQSVSRTCVNGDSRFLGDSWKWQLMEWDL
jgi:hypothetical protein